MENRLKYWGWVDRSFKTLSISAKIVNKPKEETAGDANNILNSKLRASFGYSEFSLSSSVQLQAKWAAYQIIESAIKKIDNEYKLENDSIEIDVKSEEYASQKSLIWSYINEIYSSAHKNLLILDEPNHIDSAMESDKNK